MTDDDRPTEVAEAITKAIADWLASDGGGFVTAFACSIEYLDADGDRCWATVTADNQSPSQTLGLLRWHTLDVEQQCLGFLDESRDD